MTAPTRRTRDSVGREGVRVEASAQASAFLPVYGEKEGVGGRAVGVGLVAGLGRGNDVGIGIDSIL